MAHRYNDDLLLHADQRRLAEEELATIFFALDHEKLRTLFEDADKVANEAKRRAQKAGVLAVFMALLAFLIAAGEPWLALLIDPLPKVIVFLAAILGVASMVIAWIGLIHGSRKDEWLHHRLLTERLRQWHFQYMIFHLPEIAAASGDPARIEEYCEARDRRLEAFTLEYTDNPETHLSEILDPGKLAPVWLIAPGKPPHITRGMNVDPIFDAYRELRFVQQKNYAAYVLRERNQQRGAALPLKQKRSLLTGLTLVAFLAVIALHILIGAHEFGFAPNPPSASLHIAVIWVLLITVAAKTLMEGFAIDRDLERYEEYYAVTSNLLVLFDNASTAEKKVELMLEMEKASFEEMRRFLRSTSESRFIM